MVYWTIFSEGWSKWNIYFESNWKEKPSNPYEIESEEWKAWNRGWNLNVKGVARKDSCGQCWSCGSSSRNCIC